jgi:hypothetical protein
MPSALSFHLVYRLKRICVSYTLELVVSRFINISCVNFVIWDISNSILLELGRSRFLDVGHVHVIPTFKAFLLSIGCDLDSWDVLNLEFVSNKSVVFDNLFVLNMRLQNLSQRVLDVLISGFWYLESFHLPLEYVEFIFFWIIELVFKLLKVR